MERLHSMSINELEKEIETLNQQICDLCKEQEYERASQLREKRIKQQSWYNWKRTWSWEQKYFNDIFEKHNWQKPI